MNWETLKRFKIGKSTYIEKHRTKRDALKDFHYYMMEISAIYNIHDAAFSKADPAEMSDVKVNRIWDRLQKLKPDFQVLFNQIKTEI